MGYAVGVERFDYVEWHKREKGDLIAELGLTGKIQYGEVPN